MRNRRRAGKGRELLVAAALAALLFDVTERAAAADSAAPALPAKERAVTLETVAGSPIKRVVLSAKAAARLDVKTGAVGAQSLVPTQMVGGVVVTPSAGNGSAPTAAPANGSARSGAGGELWIRVALTTSEMRRLAKDKPVRILPLETRPALPKEMLASPTDQPPQESSKSGMVTVFYAVPAERSGLVPGDRVRVELQLEGRTDMQKVVPYSAVYYDAKGDAWVYVNAAPLAFMRERVSVERVAGDLALLSSGPDVGTRVATVGVSLLYGAEIFGK